MTQEKILLSYLADIYPQWIEGYKLHGLSTGHGFIGSRGERTARELRETGKLERKFIGKFVAYRWIPQDRPSPLAQELHALLEARQPQSVQARLL